MNRVLLIVLLALSVPSAALGNDIICGNAVRPACANTTGVTHYLPSQEPSSVQAGCTVIPDSQATTQAQRTLMQSNATHPGALFPRNYPCYLKVEAGLGVEMTLAEKQAVDAAQQVILTAKAALDAEANDPQCRTVTPAQIDTFFDNLMDNPGNTNDLAGDIASITTNTPLAIRTALTASYTRFVNVLRKIAKCERAKGER